MSGRTGAMSSGDNISWEQFVREMRAQRGELCGKIDKVLAEIKSCRLEHDGKIDALEQNVARIQGCKAARNQDRETQEHAQDIQTKRRGQNLGLWAAVITALVAAAVALIVAFV